MLICYERKALLFRWNSTADKFKRTKPKFMRAQMNEWCCCRLPVLSISPPRATRELDMYHAIAHLHCNSFIHTINLLPCHEKCHHIKAGEEWRCMLGNSLTQAYVGLLKRTKGIRTTLHAYNLSIAYLKLKEYICTTGRCPPWLLSTLLAI
jgi:hypothetical protein